MDLRAIDTQYKQRWYRSRHEARWAVFLDTLGEPFQYELEGYELPPIPRDDAAMHIDPSDFLEGQPMFYVPDFWLPRVKQWIEIKPYTGPESMDKWTLEKARRLTYHTGYQTIVCCGTPAWTEPGVPASNYAAFSGEDSNYVWCECLFCQAVGVQYGGRSERLLCCDRNTKREGGHWANYATPRLKQAFHVAANHRFFLEHPDALFHRNLRT